MANEYPNALVPQPFNVGAVLLVTALDRIALVDQDFGNGAHANPAYADDVKGADIVGHFHGLASLVLGLRRRCAYELATLVP